MAFLPWRAGQLVACDSLFLRRASVDTHGSTAQGEDAAKESRDPLNFALSFFRALCGF